MALKPSPTTMVTVTPAQGRAGVLMRKAFKGCSEWTEKDDILDVVYWARQIIGALFGLLFGIMPLRGGLAIVLYVAISTLSLHFYVTSFQKVDEDWLGGFWEIAKEGFGSSFATFLVFWIVFYTAMYNY
ncbi:unnamed protein product [Soboliphyme baturini]|uniref:Rab5-interacting protein n=1 Tax=Soboliphyme baturini TaxID=241478 RepID=A0A183J2M7_9BILA|nr:unnamed protein product [Soboliphyme baturini]